MERFRPSPDINPSEQRHLVPNYASFYGEPLLPPSDEGQRLTEEGFIEKFPVRYSIWNTLQEGLQDSSDISMNNPQTIQWLRTRLHLLNQFDRYATTHHAKPEKVKKGETKLMPKQFDVFEDIHEMLEKGINEGTLKAPTAFGKTVLFNQAVAAADVPTIIMVPTQKLVEQTYKQFQERTPDISVGRVYGGAKEYGRQVTITTYASLVADEGRLINRAGIQMVILDEVHEGTSKKRVEKMEAIEGFRDAVLLGFSATPVEIRDPRYKETRVGRMSRNMIHEIGIQEAVEEGYLSSLSCTVVKVKADLSNIDITSLGEFHEGQLNEAINNEIMNKAAVEFFLEAKEQDIEEQKRQGKRKIRPLTTSLFAASIAHAQELARRLQEQGIRAAAVWGNQNPKERNEILRKWETGEIEVVCSKNLLIQGIDVHSIRMVMNVAPTASKIVELQRTGRGLRIDKNNPDKVTRVVDFVYITESEGEIVSGSKQVIYPHIIGAAELYKNKLKTIPYKPPRPQEKGEKAKVGGVEVVTDPDEVMEITNKIKDREISEEILEFAPDGWVIIGTQDTPESIAGKIGKSVGWVQKNLHSVLVDLKKKYEENPIILQGNYLDKKGRIFTYYSPLVLEELKKIVGELTFAPEGWYIVGEKRKDQTLAGILAKSPDWIENRIAEIIEKIKKEQNDEQIPITDRENNEAVYLDKSKKPTKHYSKRILDELKAIKDKQAKSPEGWMVIGDLNSKATLSYVLKRSNTWIKRHIDKILIQREEEQIDNLGQTLLYKTYLDKVGREAVFYSPVILDELTKLAAEEG